MYESWILAGERSCGMASFDESGHCRLGLLMTQIYRHHKAETIMPSATKVSEVR